MVDVIARLWNAPSVPAWLALLILAGWLVYPLARSRFRARTQRRRLRLLKGGR